MSLENFTTWMIILICLLLFVSIVLSIVIWSLRNGISPMPTSTKAKQRLLEALPSQIVGTIYELGSGWGTLALPLAERYPKCQVIGYETSTIPLWVSKIRLLFKGYTNVKIENLDFFKCQLSDAELVICYLYPEAMNRLKTKFHEELKSGTWVVSNTFAIPGWKTEGVYIVGDLYRTKIYVYRIQKL